MLFEPWPVARRFLRSNERCSLRSRLLFGTMKLFLLSIYQFLLSKLSLILPLFL